MVKRCIICNQVLTKENDSPEHIFLKSLGDKDPKWGLLCKGCNNYLGTYIDQPFMKIFEPLYRTVSGKTEKVRMDFSDGHQYIVQIKNGVLDESFKPLAVNPIVEKNDTEFNAKFLNTDEAKKFMEKIKKRYEKKGKHVEQKLTSKMVDLKITGDKFSLTPSIDEFVFVLEVVKIQTEYLHSINYQVKNGSFLYGDLVFRPMVNHFDDAVATKRNLGIMKQWTWRMFENVIIPMGLTNTPIAMPLKQGYSEARVIDDITGKTGEKVEFTVINLMGLITIWVPVLTADNLVNLFGGAAMFLNPYDTREYE